MANIGPIKIILSGGGTGGHLYPALAIAEALQRQAPSVELLFVGALGKLEMEKVPAAGHRIIGLDIRGFQRRFSWQNFLFPYRVIKSYGQSLKIIRDFKPLVAVGVGGYASGPLLKAAEAARIPTVLQEQNSFPGKTNLLLAKKAARIFVAYPGMERFFDSDKIRLFGNPVRANLALNPLSPPDARRRFSLEPNTPTLLILGGSGGAKMINLAIMASLERLYRQDIQLIWQTGATYQSAVSQATASLNEGKGPAKWVIMPFLEDIHVAYAACDVVISRAGAGTISELSLLGKPVILVPSPHVAEDHQTKNALSLVDRGAARMVRDNAAMSDLVEQALSLLQNKADQQGLSAAIRQFAYPAASEDIATEILQIAHLSAQRT